MKDKGLTFSFDLFISFLIMCSMLYIILLNFNLIVESNEDAERDWLLQKNGIYLLDSLVKNSDENNSILGSAYYNPEKRRVESNVIDYSLLQKAEIDAVDLGGGFFIKGLSIEFKSGDKEILFSSNRAGDCLAFERFVLIKKLLNEKGKVRAEVCYGE